MESNQPDEASAFDEIVKSADIPLCFRELKGRLRFPETLMLLIIQAEREAVKNGLCPQNACIMWTPDGTAIIIRDKDDLIKNMFPLMSLSRCKFASFARKLYRWGFRQVFEKSKRKSSARSEMVFAHRLFLRDHKHLVAAMKSLTAEAMRKTSVAQATMRPTTSQISQQLGNNNSACRELMSKEIDYHFAACRESELYVPTDHKKSNVGLTWPPERSSHVIHAACMNNRWLSSFTQNISLPPLSQPIAVLPTRSIDDREMFFPPFIPAFSRDSMLAAKPVLPQPDGLARLAAACLSKI